MKIDIELDRSRWDVHVDIYYKVRDFVYGNRSSGFGFGGSNGSDVARFL